MKKILIVLFGTVVPSATALAQALSGTIVGTVTDPQGAAVPSAKLTLRNEGTGFTRTIETNQNGEYVAYSFPTGSVVVTVEQPGFQKLVRTGIVLTAADTLTVDVQLQVGNLQETVTVNEGAPLLQTESAAISALLNNRQILDLPLNGRSFTQLLTIQPGATAMAPNLATGGAYNMRANTSVSVNGSQTGNNGYLVDGMYDQGLWLNNLVIVPTIDSIQEVRVLASNFSAEFGDSAGSVTVVQSKSGTNQFHGSAYEFLRNDKLDANNFFNSRARVANPPFRRNEFGGTLAKKGVAFVSINYRLGVFGFLAHPDLTKESEHHSSGNYALLDQVAALRWIQRNIAKFGGNPNSVMLFGHSAGASNLAVLMASPLAKGLFQRAAGMSGGLGNQLPLAQAEEAGARFAEALGAHSISELRAKSAQEILKAGRTLNSAVVDGWFLPDDVYNTFAAGKQIDVPMIAGSVGDDGPGAAMPTKAADVPRWAHENYGNFAEEFLKVFPAASDSQAAKASHDFRRDRSLVGARTWLSLHAQSYRSKAYWYLFDHASPMPPGAMFSGRPAVEMGSYHGGELVYIWNNLYLKDWPWMPADHQLGEVMSSLWTNFARNGEPNGTGLPKWPAYDPKNELLLYITTAPKSQPPPYRPELEFLTKATLAARKR